MDKSLKITLIISISLVSFTIFSVFFLKPVVWHFLLQNCIQKAEKLEAPSMVAYFQYEKCKREGGNEVTCRATSRKATPTIIEKEKAACYNLYK